MPMEGTNGNPEVATDGGIAELTVSGFKSIRDQKSIEIRPLTIFAGANSSGKSSAIQPLLLLKQTLEASFDPGPLLLSGPNVKFTSASQFLSHFDIDKKSDSFHVSIKLGSDTEVGVHFRHIRGKGLVVDRTEYRLQEERGVISPSMTSEQIQQLLPASVKANYDSVIEGFSKHIAKESKKLGGPAKEVTSHWRTARRRWFLVPAIEPQILPDGWTGEPMPWTPPALLEIEHAIRRIIHLPGLRGSPERTYPVTAVGTSFPGLFQDYAASVLAQWEAEKEHDRIRLLERDLLRLGLTWKVRARRTSDTQVQIKVGRLKEKSKSFNLVNIADVGLGMSQALPVLVALHAAEPGQLVFLEQPEIHLHPDAQTQLASVLAGAAKRGVRVIAETHSSLLLLGVQTLVAEGKLDPNSVKLHWFTRNHDGVTEISGADLDSTGAFGNWPEDFADVTLLAENRYLSAAQSHVVRSKTRGN